MAQRLPFIYVANSAIHGRGVFTAEPLSAGDIIEICPVIVLPPEQLTIIHNSKLHDYYFLWGPDQDRPAIALGYGSIYNHAYEANANYRFDYVNNTIDFFAVKPIAAGEEITVNYNGEPNNTQPVWFHTGKAKNY